MSIRKEICRIGRRLEEKGFVAATDGNISCKIAPDQILITPSGIPKGDLTENDLIVIDPEGRLMEGDRKPSSETLMHLAVYRERSDVYAVIHAIRQSRQR